MLLILCLVKIHWFFWSILCFNLFLDDFLGQEKLKENLKIFIEKKIKIRQLYER